jgi:hypothetical protein
MNDSDRHSMVAEQLQELLLGSEDVDRFLEDLAVYSSNILGGDTEVHCGVTLRRSRRALTVASSSGAGAPAR